MYFLDSLVRYNDTSLPPFSSLSFLFISILISSFAIASDVGKYLRPAKKRVSFANQEVFTSIGMLGCRGMGGDMAIRFAENGINVLLSDPSTDAAVDAVIGRAGEVGLEDKIQKCNDYKTICSSLSTPRLIVLTLPHRNINDQLADRLLPHLSRDDIILDCGTEQYAKVTKVSKVWQNRFKDAGVRYISSGIEAGYLPTRAGPWDMSEGDEAALDEVIPLLRRIADN